MIIASALISLNLLGMGPSDVKLVTEFRADRDLKKATAAFIRLSEQKQVEWPMKAPSTTEIIANGSKPSKMALSSSQTLTFLSALWSAGCSPKVGSSKTSPLYNINALAIHCYARVCAEAVHAYAQIMNGSHDRQTFSNASINSAVQLSRLRWSIVNAGEKRLPAFASYKSILDKFFTKSVAKSPNQARMQSIQRYELTAKSLKELSQKNLKL